MLQIAPFADQFQLLIINDQFYNKMNFLKKHHQNNLKAFQKCSKFLQSKGYDLNNLPKVQAKKPVIQITQPPRGNLTKPQDEQSDSEDFDMMAYMQSKKQSNNAISNQIRNQSFKSYQTNEENNIQKRNNYDLSQFSYNNSNNDFHENFDWQKGNLKASKQPPRERKENFSSKWKLIDKSAYKNKVKIDQVIKNFQPAKANYILADNKQWENHKKHEDHRLYYILSRFPKIKQFKNNQKAIVKCGLQNNDIFVCMPTGGGKSLTFQMLTFLIKGVYLCILPLVSLIFDQDYQAKILGIEAYSLTGNTTQSDVKMIYSKLNNYSRSENSIVIFCTPQKLNLSPAFSEVMEQLYHQDHLKRIVIDEVHCVSTWGKEFRIEYENLSNLKKKFPKTPILALTATVTEVVKQDIIGKLGIQNCYFFQSSFNRPNLYYQVKNKDKNIFPQIQQIIRRYRNKTGIIYCLSRKSCEEMSEQLNKKGYNSSFYHAEIAEEEKKSIQQRWMRNEIYIIVATVAFGMGINKPDVRFVIHHSMSKSLQNYYQQSGRAGRDGEYSECILFYRKLDKQFLMSMTLRNDFSTKESKQFSTKQLAQMIKYCEDKSTCRRQFQLRYLGEADFDPQNCHQTCDNCQKQRNFQDFECIDQAKIMIKTLLKMQQFKISISKNQFISITKKKIEKNKTLKYKIPHLTRAGINIEQLQSVFEGWKIDELQVLILEFMSNDLLTERIIESQIMRNKTENNFSNVYLKCHIPRCRIFLEQVETLPIKREVKIKQFKTNNYESLESSNGDENIDENEVDNENEQFSNLATSNLTEFQENQKKQKYRLILESLFEDDD